MATTASKQPNIRINVLINLIRTLALTALSFITFPYVTRALGDSAFGLYTWANTFVYYFLVLAKISIPNIAIRECAKVANDKEALSKKAQEFFLLQAVMTLVSFGLMCSLCFTIPALRENNTLIFLLSINFLAGLFSFEWIYIALEQHIYITVRSILTIAIAAMLTYTYIRPTGTGKNEVYIYALFTILPTILTSICNLIILPRYISFKKTQKYDFLPLMRPLMVLFVISLFVTLYNQTDSFILGFLDPSKASVGSYSVGVKGIDIVITLVTSLYTVFMPRATHLYALEDKKYYRNLLRYSMNITLFISIPAVATMMPMSSSIVTLISGEEGYVDASYALMILACMMVSFSISDNIYTQILLPQKKEKEYMTAMIGGVIANVGLSLLLGMLVFRSRPIIGVAIATMVSDIAVVAYLLYKTSDYSLRAIFNGNSLKLVIAGALVAAISYFLNPLIQRTLTSMEPWLARLSALLITVFISGIVYIAILLLLKEKLVSSFLPRNRRHNEEESHG